MRTAYEHARHRIIDKVRFAHAVVRIARASVAKACNVRDFHRILAQEVIEALLCAVQKALVACQVVRMQQDDSVVCHGTVAAPVPARRERREPVSTRIADIAKFCCDVKQCFTGLAAEFCSKIRRIKSHMVGGKHVHVSPPRTVGPEFVLLQVLEVIGLLCRTVKLRRRKGELVLAVFTAMRIVASFHVGGLLVQSFRAAKSSVAVRLFSIA